MPEDNWKRTNLKNSFRTAGSDLSRKMSRISALEEHVQKIINTHEEKMLRIFYKVTEKHRMARRNRRDQLFVCAVVAVVVGLATWYNWPADTGNTFQFLTGLF